MQSSCSNPAQIQNNPMGREISILKAEGALSSASVWIQMDTTAVMVRCLCHDFPSEPGWLSLQFPQQITNRTDHQSSLQVDPEFWH